ncbi:RelA/SpoT family protein [Rhodoferax sp. 4810]|uniref:guanosine-3',5'-bis(diphosphate) 3'-diphosphatase n=1 Tax=Thiospirillum jenense TaxID=1653858 RepID=A0A839HG65_9GAMM|nr:RelA/SpoT family protein [Thiospirillum jenense]MBB1075879.1 RelA/SpoT family protein [Rhodoferax jenense]MBB1126097.1 RelA/SpoT family protein [Thiospirillum jenense]
MNTSPDSTTTSETAVSPSLPALPLPAQESERSRFQAADLCVLLETYLPGDEIREVYRAYLFGAEMHQGQQRHSGEPYICHPLAVTRILADLHMDYKCLMAALLHDVIEDTDIGKHHLAQLFDEEIAELVDGVSKLTQIDFRTRAEAQAANFRKMMLAMTRDIRVILIKLADRLHNMRTLGVMPPEKRRRISRETLEIYAPIANRLGINHIRLQLEELGFSHYWPWRWLVLDQAMQRIHRKHQEVMGQVEIAIRRRLQQEEINGEVISRELHLYSIYNKMSQHGKTFTDLAEICAVRIVVHSIDACYRVLGQVHNLYKPVPGRFKDYIAIPKSNGYQSLHTVLIGPQGISIEVQIRSIEMHRIADAGIVSHWLYKSNNTNHHNIHTLAKDWLQNLIDFQNQTPDSQDFLDDVKIDLFPDEVYVFTPKGEILVLPKGATIVDFAYAIHSDVGNTCVGGRIDRHLAPLRTPLHSGQTVEIITAPSGTPNAAWLNFVVTGKARANIRTYLKNLQQYEAEALGRRLVAAELATLKLSLDQLDSELVAAYVVQSGLATLAQVFVEVGLGNRVALLVARGLINQTLTPVTTTTPAATTAPPLTHLAITGTEGVVVNFARCCRPIPGDPIVGLFHPGTGIVVHRAKCHNLGDYQTQHGRWCEVEWAAVPEIEFATDVRIEVGDRRGVLAVIAAAIAGQGANIEDVRIHSQDGTTSTLDFRLNVRDRGHLARIMRRLRQIPSVVRIARLSR